MRSCWSPSAIVVHFPALPPRLRVRPPGPPDILPPGGDLLLLVYARSASSSDLAIPGRNSIPFLPATGSSRGGCAPHSCHRTTPPPSGIRGRLIAAPEE